jgi:hypothetical protein
VRLSQFLNPFGMGPEKLLKDAVKSRRGDRRQRGGN